MFQHIAIPALALLLAAAPCLAAPPPQLDVRKVAPGVHAVIGDLGGQSTYNEGLNANLGFVIGNEAVLVVNSGPSHRVGEALLNAVREHTALPVKWVVNVNSQSHYWWGNAMFAEQDATLLAHGEAIGLMRAQEDAQRAALDTALGPLFAGSEAVLPISSSADWIEAFERLETLAPRVIVSGHGAPTDLEHARRDTLDYLTHMRAAALEQVEAGASPSEATRAIDQSAWSQLVNFDLLSLGNASRVFLEVEIEAF